MVVVLEFVSVCVCVCLLAAFIESVRVIVCVCLPLSFCPASHADIYSVRRRQLDVCVEICSVNIEQSFSAALLCVWCLALLFDCVSIYKYALLVCGGPLHVLPINGKAIDLLCSIIAR